MITVEERRIKGHLHCYEIVDRKDPNHPVVLAECWHDEVAQRIVEALSAQTPAAELMARDLVQSSNPGVCLDCGHERHTSNCCRWRTCACLSGPESDDGLLRPSKPEGE